MEALGHKSLKSCEPWKSGASSPAMRLSSGPSDAANHCLRFRNEPKIVKVSRGLSKLELNGQRGTVLPLEFPEQAGLDARHCLREQRLQILCQAQQLGRLAVMLHSGKQPHAQPGPSETRGWLLPLRGSLSRSEICTRSRPPSTQVVPLA